MALKFQLRCHNCNWMVNSTDTTLQTTVLSHMTLNTTHNVMLTVVA